MFWIKILEVKFITAIHLLIGANLDKPVSIAKLELLQEYGRYSMGIINEALDILSEFGIESKIRYDDYIIGLKNLKDINE